MSYTDPCTIALQTDKQMIELLAMVVVGSAQVSPTTMNVDLLLPNGTIITTTESVQGYDTFSPITK